MVRLRLAPSPTGYPHIGTIWQALINFAFAKKNQGKFIVRIEDTDRKRFVPDAEEKLFEALSWLGLNPDESPLHGGSYGPYRQSERLRLYQKYAQVLIKKGLAYYCFCSSERIQQLREELRKKGKPPKYDGHCRFLTPKEAEKKLQNKEKYVIRLKVPFNKKIIVEDLLRGKIEFNSNLIDDQVLLKSDGFPTYHLAVVIDDHLMKISHVVRGEEWLSSAPKHFLLYDFFGWKKPVFVHTPALRNPDKSKLSKRQGHTQISWYQENGYLPEAILNFLSLLGWSHPAEKTIFPLEEFIKFFDLKDLLPVGPVVDLQKLDFFNKFYIRQSDDHKLALALEPFLSFKIKKEKLEKILPLIKERIIRLNQADEFLNFLVKLPEYNSNLFKKEAVRELKLVLENLSKLSEWQTKKIAEVIKKTYEEGEFDKKDFYVNLYIAIQGKESGLPLFESLEMLGKKEVLFRFKKALEKLK